MPSKSISFSKLICFLHHETSHFGKFEGADFIYDNSFF